MKLFDYLIKAKELELQKIRENPKEYYSKMLIKSNVENICYFVFLLSITIGFYILFAYLVSNGFINF